MPQVEEKLTTLSKMVADRSNIRIDMDTHTKDIAKYEADPKVRQRSVLILHRRSHADGSGDVRASALMSLIPQCKPLSHGCIYFIVPRHIRLNECVRHPSHPHFLQAGAKLDGSKQKLAEAQERFHATEAVLVPELEQLDKEIAALTTGAFRGFIEAQMRYNAVAMEAYQAGLAAIAVAAPEGEALVAAEGEAAAVVAPEAEIAAATEAMHLEPAPAAAEAAPAAVEAAAPAAEEAAPVAAAEPATFDPFAAADAPAAEAPAS